MCMTILTCEWFLIVIGPLCLLLPPLGGRVSYEALFRGWTVDKLREVDKGRRYRNGRYTHDGDLLGIVGSASAFSSISIASPFRNHLSRPGWNTPVQSRNKSRHDRSLTLQERMFYWWLISQCLILCRCGWPLMSWFLRCPSPAKCMCCAITLVLQMEFFYPSSLFLFISPEKQKQNPDNTTNTKPSVWAVKYQIQCPR